MMWSTTKRRTSRKATLAELSWLLRSNLRASDVAARVGPEEIAVLFPDTNEEQARSVIEKLSSLVSREGSILHQSTLAEIGVATFDPSSSQTDLQAMLDIAQLDMSLTKLQWSSSR